MRRFLFALGVTAAVAISANPVDAQLKYGVQGAIITGLDEVIVAGSDVNSINGTFGLGARVMLDPPLFPLGVIGSATYYFVEEGAPSYWTGTLAAQLRLPLPIVKPYVLGGWQVRNTEGADGESGPVVGLGVQLGLGVSLFLEGTFELADDIEITGLEAIDRNRIVIKGGALLG